ncbi:MAG: TetR family transcriptional regulator [Eggerthellaceae bacterium]|nr:TetR family transcriptional regulator [Eggerthellaceae bacterium]
MNKEAIITLERMPAVETAATSSAPGKLAAEAAPDYIRARSPEQKQERMDAICAAADALFTERPYHQITMGTIADALGWSRSNLYKYAATQEEIFLELHTRKNRAWVADLANALQDAPLPVVDFARTWATVTERHAGFLRYQEILISIIESNVTLERLTEFKRNFANMLEPVVSILMRQCDVDEATAHALYLRLLYQAPGLWNHYHCAELTAEAMEAAGLPKVAGSFAGAYTDFVQLCVTDASTQPE